MVWKGSCCPKTQGNIQRVVHTETNKKGTLDIYSQKCVNVDLFQQYYAYCKSVHEYGNSIDSRTFRYCFYKKDYKETWSIVFIGIFTNIRLSFWTTHKWCFKIHTLTWLLICTVPKSWEIMFISWRIIVMVSWSTPDVSSYFRTI